MLNQKLQDIKDLVNSHIQGDIELNSAELTEHLKFLKKEDEEVYKAVLNELDSESLGEAAVQMPNHMLKDVIALPDEKVADAIEELESDDATDLIQNIGDIDENRAKQIFDSLETDSKKEISRLINYDENEAGAYMQIEVFSCELNQTLGEVIQKFRMLKNSGELVRVFQLFVLDEHGILRYCVPLDDLLLFDPDEQISEIMKKHSAEYEPHFVQDSDDIMRVAQIVKDYDLSSVPVVNKAGVLLGRITTYDIHDFLEDSATEQIYHLAGVDDEAEDEETLFKAGKARALWLCVNLITAIISSVVISYFDESINKIVALAVLMPIVASMGGNTGTQALTVTVRRLAIGEINFAHAKATLLKELSIAAVNGAIFATLMGVIAHFWFNINNLGLVIAMSMMINLSLAGLFGALIPMGLKRLNIDPAVGSSVLLTTVTDVVGFFSFLGLATWILL